MLKFAVVREDPELELGASVFLTLYRGLYESRARRDRRPLAGPHSVAAGFE